MVEKSVLFERLKAIVGSDNVTDKDIIGEAYTASYNLKEREAPGIYGKKFIQNPKKPSFIVRAGSTKEIQEIVRLANENKIPIVPMGALTSQYSESVPSEGGIMMDFSRMKKIEVDEELLSVTFEPGVVWAQAYRELAVKGYWVSFQASPASVSIMGTTTQAGTHLPWDKYAIAPFATNAYYSDLTIGAEIVLPTGELLVSGSAALPGAKPQRPRAYGPNVAALFLAAQGTLGIVVKQTLPLYRIPEYRHVVEGDFKDKDFKGLVKAMYAVIDDNFEGPVWAEKVWTEYHNGIWEFYVHLYGKKERVEFNREFTERTIMEAGGTINPKPRVLDPESDYSGGLMTFYEEMIFWRSRANSIAMPPPNWSWVNLMGTAPPTEMPEVHDAALKLLAKHGVKKDRIRSARLMPGTRRGLSINMTYFFDLNDAEEVKRADTINKEWAHILYDEILHVPPAVFARYRPVPTEIKTFMPQLGEYYKLLVKLKRTLDPNRIMNPGKLMDIEPY